MTEAAISFDNVALGYGKHKIIQALNLDIASGALLAIVGANGTGKSTLLKALMGELKPLQGVVRLNGFKQRDMAYLPQRVSLEQNFPMNVWDFVAMGLWKQIGAFNFVSTTLQQKVNEALESVALQGMAGATLSSLSGGQMQRALFARLILQDAPVILLDEPFNAVDEQTIDDLMSLVTQWHQQGRTVITVLHDQDLVRQHFPQSLCLAHGYATIGNTSDVLAKQLRRGAA